MANTSTNNWKDRIIAMSKRNVLGLPGTKT